ncbi:peroxide stress protein YaaA [Quadrisphaera sp. INWT6]|uniref:YaaA family protein n=1 Tax=Quadrisphaera sp. INWT6 TaxID=2596917 RepID=UPI0019D68492|nr:peroxide stress protein YaaA [Quadrisphaera sp. INWT6]
MFAPVLVLLPPSERKLPAPSRRGSAPVDLGSLTWPELAPARERVLEAAAALAQDPAAVGAGPSLAEEVARNGRWRTEPAQPASRVFTGVLFEALDLPSLPRSAARRAAEQVLVVSAAYGALAPDDAVPAHRLSMGTDLPGVGPLAALWREHLTPLLEHRAAEPGQVVLDCRSAAYAAAWRPSRAVAERVVAVRVFREVQGPEGPVRSVVSHDAKRTRGELARHLLLRRRREPDSPEALAAAAAEAFDVELSPAAPGRARHLDVVLRRAAGSAVTDGSAA